MILILFIYIGSFIFFPILTTPFFLIPIVQKNKLSKFYLFLFVIGISLIALRYTPFFTDDAAYHYKAAYLFQDYDNFFDWFSNLMLRNIPTEYEYYNFPLYGLLLYIFSGTGTYSLVSFVVSMLVYFSYSSILFDIYKKNNISKFLFLCTLITIIIFVNVRYTTSGMRFSLAVALTILLFYKEIENNFKMNARMFLYLIPLLIHSSVIIPILLRCILPWLKKVTMYKVLVVLFSLPVLTLLSTFVQSFGIDYLTFLFIKFDAYQDTATFISLFSNSDLVNIYVGVSVCILFIFFYANILRFYSNDALKYFFTLIFYICLLTLSSIQFLTILDRFIWYVYPGVIISVALHYAYREKNITRIRAHHLFSSILIILCFVGGLIWNRKFLDFLNFVDFNIVEIFTKNLFEYFSDLHHFSLGDVWVR